MKLLAGSEKDTKANTFFEVQIGSSSQKPSKSALVSLSVLSDSPSAR